MTTSFETAEQQRPRRPNPINVAFDNKRAEIDERISKLQKRLEALRTGDDGTLSSVHGERGRLISEQKEVREKMRTARDEANVEMKALKDIQAQIKKQKDDVREQKDKLPFKSVGEIDTRIAAMEERIETGSFSLAEEKQILQEVSKLKKNKKTLEMLESGASVDGRPAASDVGSLKMKEEVYRSRMSTKFAQVDELKKKIEENDTELVKLEGGKEAAQKKRSTRFAEMDKLRREIDGEYENRRRLQEEHREAKQKQKEAWERNKAKREEDEKRWKVEEEIYDLEGKLRNLNPASSIDKKIDECNNLHNHFSGLTGSATPAQPNSEACPEKAEKKPIVDGEFVALKPKCDREEVFIRTGPSKSKSKAHSSANQQQSNAQLSKLPIQILAALADLQLAVPTQASGIPAVLESIDKKKAEFEKQRGVAMAQVQDQQSELRAKISALQAQL